MPGRGTGQRSGRTMTDIVDELRAESLTSCQLPARPDGPSDEEAALLDRDVRWRAAAEIEQLRAAAAGWQPIQTAPKDRPILRFCPPLAGHAAKESVVGAWPFDHKPRTF